VKVEKLINYIIIDCEEQLGSVLVLLEPLPDAAVFDAARQVCQRHHSLNGSPTLQQVPSVVVSQIYFIFKFTVDIKNPQCPMTTL